MKRNDPTDFFKTTENTKKTFNVHFDYMDVRDAIDQLSANAAAGPDGMPAVLLKKNRDNLSEPLTMLWKNYWKLEYSRTI